MVDLGLIGFATNANARNALRFIHRTLKSFLVTANFTNDGLVHLLNRGSATPTIDGAFVANNGVFLTEAFLTCNGNHQIFAHGPFMNLACLGDNRVGHGHLRIPQNMKRIQIETILLVCGWSSDSLLDHSRLLRDTGCLVMIRPGHGTRRGTQNRTRMNGQMRLRHQSLSGGSAQNGCRISQEVLRIHCDTILEKFPGIHLFKNALFKKRRPRIGSLKLGFAKTFNVQQRKDDGSHIAKKKNALKRPYNRSVLRNNMPTASRAKNLDKIIRCHRTCNRFSIDKDQCLAQLGTSFEALTMLRKAFAIRKRRQSIEKSIQDKAHMNSDANLGKERQVLQKARAMAFGRFRGTL